MDGSVIGEAYSTPWQGNKSLHKQQSKDRQQSKDGQQSRGTDCRHQQNKEEDLDVNQSTAESQVSIIIVVGTSQMQQHGSGLLGKSSALACLRRSAHIITVGSLQSLDWNGGME